MSAPPFLQLFPADYLKDTGRLTTLQHGAYFLLIMDYWVNGGLPDDDEQLASIARLTIDQWVKIRPVLERFFAPGWVHGRIERDLAKAQEKNTRRVTAGKAGADARHSQGNRTGIDKTGSNATSNDNGNADSNALASSSDVHTDTSLRSVSEGRPKKVKSTKSLIAEDAQPTDADRQQAGKVGMSADVFRHQWAKFRDHHIAKGNRFASWSAAWRTWCANWVEYGGGSNARAGPPPRGRTVSDLAQMDLHEDPPYDHERTHARNGSAEKPVGSNQGGSGFAGRLSVEDAAHARRGSLVDH